MKRLFILSHLLFVTILVSAQALYVGSFNLRYLNDKDCQKGDCWDIRHRIASDLINFEQPDLFGTQELTHIQILDMLQCLPQYDFIGVGRDDGKEKGEYAAIFYNKDHIKLLKHGNFWLNETPDIPRKGWDAVCIRICTWGQFKNKENRLKFYHFNLHMDHIGIVARREAAKLIVSKIREIAKGAPVILTGDFNVDQTNEIYQIFTQSGILKDSYVCAKQKLAPNGTFNSFNPSNFSQSRIDHIMLSPNFEVEHYGVLTNMYWTEKANTEITKGHDAPKEIDFREYTPHTPSDHYPVMAKIHYKK